MNEPGSSTRAAAMKPSAIRAIQVAPFAALVASSAVHSAWMASRGDAGSHIAVFFAAWILSPLILATGLIVLLLTPAAGRLERMKFTLFATVASTVLIATIQVPGCFAATSVRERQIQDAKRWCESLAVKLEVSRREIGAYPADIQDSELLADAPELCDPRWLYRRNDDGTFSLSFYTEEGFDTIWSYRSRDGTWKYSN